jgi:hypothetical protein
MFPEHNLPHTWTFLLKTYAHIRDNLDIQHILLNMTTFLSYEYILAQAQSGVYFGPMLQLYCHSEIFSASTRQHKLFTFLWPTL